MTSPAQNQEFSLDDEVDLLEYLNAILRFKYRILLMAVIMAIAAFVFSKFKEDMFVSAALVAVNINEDPGGVNPGMYGAADVLSLIEHDFLVQSAHDNELDRLLARMTSMRFTELFITENDLLPYIFRKHWDAENKKWLDDFQPSMIEAVVFFDRKMRVVKMDDKSGLLNVSFHSLSPDLSAELANKFVERFNKYTRDNQAAELKSRSEYLTERLKQIENLELHRSIFRLMETQLAAESLLYARKDYPLEVIQEAIPPVTKAYPARKKWAALTFFGVFFLGIMVAIASVLLKKIRSGLTAYQKKELHQLEDAGSAETGSAAPKAPKLKIKKQSAEEQYQGEDWVD